MKASGRRRMVVVVVLLLLIFGLLFWIYGWGRGEIHLMDFDAEEVSYIELYSTDSVFNCNEVAVTEKEDIQSLIDLVNSFRNCGNELKYLLSGEFGTGGAVLYEFRVRFLDNDTFTIGLYSHDTHDLSDVEMTYRIFPEEHTPRLSNVCRGSLELFYELREKYV